MSVDAAVDAARPHLRYTTVLGLWPDADRDDWRTVCPPDVVIAALTADVAELWRRVGDAGDECRRLRDVIRRGQSAALAFADAIPTLFEEAARG